MFINKLAPNQFFLSSFFFLHRRLYFFHCVQFGQLLCFCFAGECRALMRSWATFIHKNLVALTFVFAFNTSTERIRDEHKLAKCWRKTANATSRARNFHLNRLTGIAENVNNDKMNSMQPWLLSWHTIVEWAKKRNRKTFHFCNETNANLCDNHDTRWRIYLRWHPSLTVPQVFSAYFSTQFSLHRPLICRYFEFQFVLQWRARR